jgi:hypothetical protein
MIQCIDTPTASSYYTLIKRRHGNTDVRSRVTPVEPSGFNSINITIFNSAFVLCSSEFLLRVEFRTMAHTITHVQSISSGTKGISSIQIAEYDRAGILRERFVESVLAQGKSRVDILVDHLGPNHAIDMLR